MIEALQAGDPPGVGPYQLVGRLGRGGMGQVFLGRSQGGRLVAVKVVTAELAGDAEFRRRFALEVDAARKVGGFYTAQVVDAATDVDRPWLVTAYIPGPSLRQAIGLHGALPYEAVRVLGAGLAEGLAAIHASGLVHRDLQPGNVILAEDGPRVIDFGIARALDVAHLSTIAIGTPGFMSPEQALGTPTGAESDVFSFGCVLAFAATGRSPYGQGRPAAIVYRVIHGEPDLSGLPEQLAPLVRACLNRDPADRPPVDRILGELAVPGGAIVWLPDVVSTMIAERRRASTDLVTFVGGATETGRTGWDRDPATGPVSGGAPGGPPPPAPSTRRLALIVALAAVVAVLLVVGIVLAFDRNGRQDPDAALSSTPVVQNADPCDVIDNKLINDNQLVDTGTPGGYVEGAVTVRSCTWRSGQFDGLSLTLVYASAEITLVSGSKDVQADLSGLPPGTTAKVGGDDSACVLGWPTTRGWVFVHAAISAYTGVICDVSVDFAVSVLPRVPE